MLAFIVSAAIARPWEHEFSRGYRIGTGCCRAAMRASDSGGLGAWEEPPTAEAIAGKRVHGGPMNRAACAVQCAALAGCTHFELNMHGSAAHSNHGQCSVFASGGYSVTTACKASSERMVCFAAGEAFTGSGLALSKSLLEPAHLFPWADLQEPAPSFHGQIAHNSKKLRVSSSNTPLRVDRSAPRVRVLALVLSSDSIHARAIRQRIRASWMAALPATMRALFVIGGLTDGVARVNGSLVNGDELFLATDDSYAGLAAKVLDALAWAERHSDSFDYLLKVDDDTFVCPTMVVEWLQGQRRDRLYAGQPQYFYKGGDGKEFSIPVAKEGRWANKPHIRIFGSSNYARYMLGGGYVLSVDAVRNVVRNARARDLFGTTLRREGNIPTVEDALIGSLLEASAEHVIMPALAAVLGKSGEKRKLARPEEHCHQESSILFHPIDFSVVGPVPLGPPSRVLFEPG